MVDVAQSVRVTDCGSEGRGFESHLPPQKSDARFLPCVFLLYVISVCKQPKSPPSKYAPAALCFLVARGNVVVGCEDKRDFIFKGILASPLAVESHLPPQEQRKVLEMRVIITMITLFLCPYL